MHRTCDIAAISPGLDQRDADGEGGNDEREVFAELLDIVEEVIALYHADKRPLPPATAGRFTASAAE